MQRIIGYIAIVLILLITLPETQGQNVGDTLLIFNNRNPKFHKGIPTYKLSDFLASDSLATNISYLKIKSFLISPDCYCDCEKTSTDGKINNEMKNFIKSCRKKIFKIYITNIKSADKLNNEFKLKGFLIMIKNK